MAEEHSENKKKLNFERMLSYHAKASQRLAQQLLADTMAIRPEELIYDALEPFFDNLFEFAYHARRVTELTGAGKGDVIDKENYFRVEGPPDAIQYNYEDILNYLIHCRSISIGIVNWTGKKIWAGSDGGDKIIGYITVETDQRETQMFYVFPLISHFLHKVLPRVLTPKNKPSAT